MQFQAVLTNAQHPEYGVATIPFPIEQGKYDHTVEATNANLNELMIDEPSSQSMVGMEM